MALGNLLVSIRATADDFNADMKKIQKDADALEKSIKPIKESFADMGKTMSVAGIAIVGAFVAMTKATADYLDNLNDARQKTGVAANDLANLGFAAEQSGSSFEGMSIGLKFLAKNMEAASSGGKQQAEAFDRLGISVTDATGKLRPTKDVMLDIADRFANMNDGAEKSAISMQIFGKSGADLIPTLNAGSAGLAEMATMHEKLAGVITDQAASAGDEFNDRLKELTTSFQGLTLVVGETFMPILTDLMTSARDIIASFRSWAAEHTGLIKAVGALGLALAGAGGLLLGVTGVLVILPQLTAAFVLLTGPVGLTVAAIAALAAGIIHFRKEIAGALLYALSKAVQGFSKFIGFAANLAEAVGLDGVAGKLKTMKFNVEETADSLDRMSNDALAPNVSVTKQAAAAVKEHTFQLGASQKAIDEHQKALDKARETIQRYVSQAQNELVKAEQAIQSEMTRSVSAITAADAAWKKLLDKAADADFFQAKMQGAGIGAVGAIIQEEAQKTLSAPIPINTRIAFDAEAEKKKLNAAVTEIKESAGKIFDDMFIKGESVFSSLTNLLKGGALSLGRSIFEDVAGALLGPIKKAFNDFFEGLLESTGIKAFVSGLGQKLGGLLSGLFGGGGGAAGAVAGGASSAAGGASSAAGGIAGGAGSLAGGLLSGGLAALGGIIGGFIARGKTEEVANNTHNIQVEIKDLIEQIMWPIHGMLERTEGHNITQVNQLDAIYNAANDNELMLAGVLTTEFGLTRDSGRDTATAITSKMEVLIRDMTARIVDAIRQSGNITLDGKQIAMAVSDSVNFGGVRLTASEVRR